MRLVIDLQACQHGSHHDAALRQARQLARHAGEHEIWIVLDGALPERLDLLRAAFDGLLPPERLRVYQLPAPNGHFWLARAAELVRDNFLRGLNPDLVYAPALYDGATACAGRPPAGLPTAFSVAEAASLAMPGGDGPAQQEWQRRQACLRAAALLLAATPALARQLRTLAEAEAGQAAPAIAVEPRHEDEDLDHDGAAVAARLWPLFAAAATAAAPAVAPARRPRLAYLSPLPPEPSGIADYSADVVPALARYYDIDIVAAQAEIGDARISADFPLRSPAWFEAHAHEFDRIVYHFGNNPMHGYMFDLLPRHPGVVILHDFFLSGVIDYLDNNNGHNGNFGRMLYHSHGYTPLTHMAQGSDRNDAVWAYPANLAVLEQAAGVIVHSEFTRQLAQRWYGPGYGADWHVANLPRRPLPRRADTDQRAGARRALGLNDDDFLVCSFGMLGETKLNRELIDAFLASPLAADPRCKLVFVGHNADTVYGRGIGDQIAASGLRQRIAITGFAPAALYADYAAAADIAVQLRSMTRGETSAAILDCLLYGAATIINAHGAGAELPDHAVFKLPDQFTEAELATALARLHGDAALRAELGAAGAALVRERHSPDAAAHSYHEAIERYAAGHVRSGYRALNTALARLPGAADVGHAELLDTARAIAANQPATPPRQLFVDISALAESDLKTGIQRVVRSVLKSLIDQPPAGYRVEPVWGNGGGRTYRYARRYMLEQLGVTSFAMEDSPIDARPGDFFLGLDLATNSTTQNQEMLLGLRRRGVQVQFVMYDVLPLLRPDWFPHGTHDYFSDYMHTLLKVADGIQCISRAVADELHQWLREHGTRRRGTPLGIGYFHLGADIDASAPSTGLPPDADHVLAQVASRPTLLMVGTVEPRKGHAQALAAFDLLWKQGVEVNLVVVGKHGWMVDQVAKAMLEHPQNGRRLHWLSGVSDEMLLKLYHASSGLLAASEGEGFGLPLIEAAQHGLPIVARDIAVFREVAQQHATYFSGLTAEDLAATMRDWLDLLQKNKVSPSSGMRWLTWEESARELLAAALTPVWQHLIPPEE